MNLDYSAGFFDGEGCISARYHKPKNRPTPHIEFVLSISNTRRESVEAFKAEFGGAVGFHQTIGNRKPQWMWHLTRRDRLHRFVEKMDGRLVLKAEQLNVLKDWLSQTRNRQYGRRRMDVEENERRLILYQQIRSLNARGRQPRLMPERLTTSQPLSR